MTFDITHYRTGYSMGVGGIVMFGDNVLLTCFGIGANKGEWAIPGGFVERDETITAAVQREILEETGVNAEVDGLIGVRHRFTKDENSAYFIFLLHADSGEAQADGIEIQEARFFTFDEVQNLPRLRTFSKTLVNLVFEQKTKLLTAHAHPDFSLNEFILYA